MLDASEESLGDFFPEVSLERAVLGVRARLGIRTVTTTHRRLRARTHVRGVVVGIQSVVPGVRGVRRPGRSGRDAEPPLLLAPPRRPRVTRAAHADTLGRPQLRRAAPRGPVLRALQQNAFVVREEDAANARVRFIVRPEPAADAPLTFRSRHEITPGRIAVASHGAAEGTNLELVVRVRLVVVRRLGREGYAGVIRHRVTGSDHNVVRNNRALAHASGLVDHRTLTDQRARHHRVRCDPCVGHDVRPGEPRVRADDGAAAERAPLDHRARPDHAPVADDAPAADHRARVHRTSLLQVDLRPRVFIRRGVAPWKAVDVGAHGVDPPVNHVATHCVVGAEVSHAGGVLARAELVRVDVVAELAFVQGAAHEVTAQVLVVEVVGEEHEHLGRADVDVAVL